MIRIIKSFIYGLFGFIFALSITFSVHLFSPSADLEWTLIAVGITGFFAAFFAKYFSERDYDKRGKLQIKSKHL